MDDVEMELDLGEGVVPTDEFNFDAPIMEATGDSEAPPVAMDADPVPTKVHIRGLDEMTTKDIRAFVGEHFTEEIPGVEWIDDTSANLAFDSPETAMQALEALAAPAVDMSGGVNTLQLRNAKVFASKPGTELAVRLAVSTDRKKARAADESRFYLMHPEHDPRERRRRHGGRSRSRDGGMRRRRYGSQEHARRRRDDEHQGFNASMYDDGDRDGDEAMSGADSGNERRRRGVQRDREQDRDRDRPSRGRSRSRSPMSRREENKGKELFSSGTRTAQKHVINAGKELFAGRTTTNTSTLASDDRLPSDSDRDGSTTTRELFPQKGNGSSIKKGRSLFSRISGSAATESTEDGGGDGEGRSIRGAAGFSIKGAGAASSENTERKLRELFPDKTRNRGKELMDRVTPVTSTRQGQGHRERSKAETFY